jgi:predicted NBD/HSP70 family sugar kinase
MSGPIERSQAVAGPVAGSGRRFGVDVGGTKMRTALAGPDGRILAEATEPTVGDSAAGLVARIAEALDRLRAEAAAGQGDGPIVAAGVALPGGVDPRTGRLDSVHNVPGLRDTDHLRADLEAALGMPVAIDNDANAAAIAERAHGVARGFDDVAVMAIGTGIGLGLIAGGRLIHGARGMAGEIAFLPVGGARVGSRPTLPDGSSDQVRTADAAPGDEVPAYEALVAGPGLRRRIDAAILAGPPTGLRTGANLGEVAAAAAAGDVSAVALLEEEARLVALGIAALTALLDPALVVLSGGVGSVPGLLEPVRRQVASLVLVPPRIETGALGERGPLVGALELANVALTAGDG